MSAVQPQTHQLPPSVGLLWETWHPIILGGIAAIIGWHYGYLHLLASSAWVSGFVDRVVNANAIVVAYLAAIIAILPAVEDKNIVQKFRQAGHYPKLIKYIASALWGSLALLVASIAMASFSESVRSQKTFDGFYSAAWWLLLAFSVSAMIRVTRLMLKLLNAS